MTTTKSLSEQVSEIKAANTSIAAKKRAFISLGITNYEADLLLADIIAERRNAKTAYTFGVEIECLVPRRIFTDRANANGLAISYEGYNHRDNSTHFKCVPDASIQGENPIECVSPVLKSTNGFKALENCCKSLNEAGARVNKSTGLHVHIGAADLTGDQYVSVFVNYEMLETLIDSFMAESRRRNNAYYARSMKGTHLAGLHSATDVARALTSRYYKVNPHSYARHHTIEFRQHQGSTDFEKISNWVRFCAKLVQWSKTNRLTAPVASINDIPFLSASEKAFFTKRAAQLA